MSAQRQGSAMEICRGGGGGSGGGAGWGRGGVGELLLTACEKKM